MTSSEVQGIMAMMPAFTTADGDSVQKRITVDAQALKAAVEKIIQDGVDVIATTGS